MHSLIEGPNSYRVEVSGWNVKGVFFVESAILSWTDAGGKSVELMSRLHQSSVVFVRLIHSIAGKANFPVAYRVMSSIASGDADNRECVQLTQLHPNIAADQEAIGATSSASQSPHGQKIFAN